MRGDQRPAKDVGEVWAIDAFVRGETGCRVVGVHPCTFQLEIAERTVMDARGGDPISVLHRLHEMGPRVAMDNFGTGSSSLACLKALPLDVLNIDRRFISGLGECRDDEVIVRAVINLAEAFGIDAVAEGAETDGQHQWLLDEGCRFAQGFQYSRPLTTQAAGGPAALPDRGLTRT